ncbi:succinyldiaminopimelate aminotransferase apoenzyme [Nitrosomonas marina]|uniref:Succinyldiaminopimelate aminotransferase apoenzyme n=1 Tax=Nitrosomonas marina TaxID=917 RepID=A0A1I0BTP8_9PROT|nr:succinyldiaminopimelate transaminase [Nitrosomonas marina]SET10325.1 succinyldiaminopimelate aminotransferase apoenzyme [Nitrosomonas marina]
MNSNLDLLQPYPFQKLRKLFENLAHKADLSPINLHIGEPKHATPDFIRQAMVEHLHRLSNYPTTQGMPELRHSIADWIVRRFNVPAINPDSEIIPVNGSREALFSFAQAVIDTAATPAPYVVCPNPFYQIYEGAALLGGASPQYINTTADNAFRLDFSQLPDTVWSRTQLIYVCNPNNPTGSVMSLDEWRQLFELSDRYGCIIAADECYSEIYFNENRPPLGALTAAHQLGRTGFPRLVVFNSLSKRSNVPGLRSGFVAGDAQILEKYLLYRTYHGCAMNPATQAASIAAWCDETHVAENRHLYTRKFSEATTRLSGAAAAQMPDAGFYLWYKTPISDTDFTRQLRRDYNVTVLPGSYLGREVHGVNPGKNHVRIALVAPLVECIEAIDRIKNLLNDLSRA